MKETDNFSEKNYSYTSSLNSRMYNDISSPKMQSKSKAFIHVVPKSFNTNILINKYSPITDNKDSQIRLTHETQHDENNIGVYNKDVNIKNIRPNSQEVTKYDYKYLNKKGENDSTFQIEKNLSRTKPSYSLHQNIDLSYKREDYLNKNIFEYSKFENKSNDQSVRLRPDIPISPTMILAKNQSILNSLNTKLPVPSNPYKNNQLDLSNSKKYNKYLPRTPVEINQKKFEESQSPTALSSKSQSNFNDRKLVSKSYKDHQFVQKSIDLSSIANDYKDLLKESKLQLTTPYQEAKNKQGAQNTNEKINTVNANLETSLNAFNQRLNDLEKKLLHLDLPTEKTNTIFQSFESLSNNNTVLTYDKPIQNNEKKIDVSNLKSENTLFRNNKVDNVKIETSFQNKKVDNVKIDSTGSRANTKKLNYENRSYNNQFITENNSKVTSPEKVNACMPKSNNERPPLRNSGKNSHNQIDFSVNNKYMKNDEKRDYSNNAVYEAGSDNSMIHSPNKSHGNLSIRNTYFNTTNHFQNKIVSTTKNADTSFTKRQDTSINSSKNDQNVNINKTETYGLNSKYFSKKANEYSNNANTYKLLQNHSQDLQKPSIEENISPKIKIREKKSNSFHEKNNKSSYIEEVNNINLRVSSENVNEKYHNSSSKKDNSLKNDQSDTKNKHPSKKSHDKENFQAKSIKQQNLSKILEYTGLKELTATQQEIDQNTINLSPSNINVSNVYSRNNNDLKKSWMTDYSDHRQKNTQKPEEVLASSNSNPRHVLKSGNLTGNKKSHRSNILVDQGIQSHKNDPRNKQNKSYENMQSQSQDTEVSYSQKDINKSNIQSLSPKYENNINNSYIYGKASPKYEHNTSNSYINDVKSPREKAKQIYENHKFDKKEMVLTPSVRLDSSIDQNHKNLKENKSPSNHYTFLEQNNNNSSSKNCSKKTSILSSLKIDTVFQMKDLKDQISDSRNSKNDLMKDTRVSGRTKTNKATKVQNNEFSKDYSDNDGSRNSERLKKNIRTTEKVLETYMENNNELKQVIINSRTIYDNNSQKDEYLLNQTNSPIGRSETKDSAKKRRDIVEKENETIKTFFMKKRINEFEQVRNINTENFKQQSFQNSIDSKEKDKQKQDINFGTKNKILSHENPPKTMLRDYYKNKMFSNTQKITSPVKKEPQDTDLNEHSSFIEKKKLSEGSLNKKNYGVENDSEIKHQKLYSSREFRYKEKSKKNQTMEQNLKEKYDKFNAAQKQNGSLNKDSDEELDNRKNNEKKLQENKSKKYIKEFNQKVSPKNQDMKNESFENPAYSKRELTSEIVSQNNKEQLDKSAGHNTSGEGSPMFRFENSSGKNFYNINLKNSKSFQNNKSENTKMGKENIILTNFKANVNAKYQQNIKKQDDQCDYTPYNKNERTILEGIKQFKYLDTSNEGVLSQYVHLSILQYQLGKNIKTYFENNKDKLIPLELPAEFNDLNLNTRNKVILLDLDETQVRSEEENEIKSYDKIINVSVGPDYSQSVGIKLRPYCIEFLKNISKKFEIVIFTASQEDYAEKVVDFQQEEMGNDYRDVLKKRLFRQHCRPYEKSYVKDLSVQNLRMDDLIIVDNLIQSFALQLENGIPILSFIDDINDTELIKLEQVLTTIRAFQDTRDFIRLNLRQNCFYNFLNRNVKSINAN